MPQFDESLFDEVGFDEEAGGAGDTPRQTIFKTAPAAGVNRQFVSNAQTGVDLFKAPPTQSGSKLFR